MFTDNVCANCQLIFKMFGEIDSLTSNNSIKKSAENFSGCQLAFKKCLVKLSPSDAKTNSKK